MADEIESGLPAPKRFREEAEPVGGAVAAAALKAAGGGEFNMDAYVAARDAARAKVIAEGSGGIGAALRGVGEALGLVRKHYQLADDTERDAFRKAILEGDGGTCHTYLESNTPERLVDALLAPGLEEEGGRCIFLNVMHHKAFVLDLIAHLDEAQTARLVQSTPAFLYRLILGEADVAYDSDVLEALKEKLNPASLARIIFPPSHEEGISNLDQMAPKLSAESAGRLAVILAPMRFELAGYLNRHDVDVGRYFNPALDLHCVPLMDLLTDCIRPEKLKRYFQGDGFLQSTFLNAGSVARRLFDGEHLDQLFAFIDKVGFSNLFVHGEGADFHREPHDVAAKLMFGALDRVPELRGAFGERNEGGSSALAMSMFIRQIDGLLGPGAEPLPEETSTFLRKIRHSLRVGVALGEFRLLVRDSNEGERDHRQAAARLMLTVVQHQMQRMLSGASADDSLLFRLFNTGRGSDSHETLAKKPKKLVGGDGGFQLVAYQDPAVRGVLPVDTFTDDGLWRKILLDPLRPSSLSHLAATLLSGESAESGGETERAEVDFAEMPMPLLIPLGIKNHATVLVLSGAPQGRAEDDDRFTEPQETGTCWYRSVYEAIRYLAIDELGRAGFKDLARRLKEGFVGEWSEIVETNDLDDLRAAYPIFERWVERARVRAEHAALAAGDPKEFRDAVEGYIERDWPDGRRESGEGERTLLDNMRILFGRNPDWPKGRPTLRQLKGFLLSDGRSVAERERMLNFLSGQLGVLHDPET